MHACLLILSLLWQFSWKMAHRGAGQWYGWDLLSGGFKFLQIASQGQWRRAAWLKSKTDPEQKSNTDFASLWRKKDRGKDKGQIYCFFLSFILIINAYIDSSFCIACVACFTCIVYTVYHIKFVLVENMKNTNHSLTIWQLEINRKRCKTLTDPLGYTCRMHCWNLSLKSSMDLISDSQTFSVMVVHKGRHFPFF